MKFSLWSWLNRYYKGNGLGESTILRYTVQAAVMACDDDFRWTANKRDHTMVLRSASGLAGRRMAMKFVWDDTSDDEWRGVAAAHPSLSKMCSPSQHGTCTTAAAAAGGAGDDVTGDWRVVISLCDDASPSCVLSRRWSLRHSDVTRVIILWRHLSLFISNCS